MAAPTKTSFVLVPGSFSSPELYYKVVDILQKREVEYVVVPLASAGIRSSGPPGTMYDDAEAIRKATIKLLDSSLNAVLVLCSYGGIPGSQAVEGLSRSERGEGKTAVTALIYVASILVPVGSSSNDTLSEGGVERPTAVETEPYMHMDPRMPPAVFSDMPESEHEKATSIVLSHSRVSFENPLTYGGYKYIPSTYIITDADMIVKPEKQHRMVDHANESLAGGAKIKKIVFAGSGHVPMLSRPTELVDAMLEIGKSAA